MSDIEYSDTYKDAKFQYRHVTLPTRIVQCLPHPRRLLTETEWRKLGVRQSRGWVHYAIYQPEPEILLFRRPLGTDPKTGLLYVPQGKEWVNDCMETKRLNITKFLEHPKNTHKRKGWQKGKGCDLQDVHDIIHQIRVPLKTTLSIVCDKFMVCTFNLPANTPYTLGLPLGQCADNKIEFKFSSQVEYEYTSMVIPKSLVPLFTNTAIQMEGCMVKDGELLVDC